MNLSSDWQTSKHQLNQRGEYLLQSGEFSDCKFIVGQEQEIIQGHKLLLAMSSPVFKTMFYGNITQTTDSIPICDVQPEAFKTLLKYIYTDDVKLKYVEIAYELMYCGKKYMMPYLVDRCISYLISSISSKNVCKIYEIAILFEELKLKEECLKVICTNTVQVLNNPNWEEIQLKTLLTILEQNNLEINSEIELLVAVERWAKAECKKKSLNTSDIQCLRSVIGNALSKIRFLTLTPEEFTRGISTHALLRQDEAFAILMKLSWPGSNIPIPENFSTNLKSRRLVTSENESFFRTNYLDEYDPFCQRHHKYSSFC